MQSYSKSPAVPHQNAALGWAGFVPIPTFTIQFPPGTENLLKVFQKCSVSTWRLHEGEQFQVQARAIWLGSLESGRSRWHHSPTGFRFCWDPPSERHPASLQDIKSDRHSHPVRDVAPRRTESVYYSRGIFKFLWFLKPTKPSLWQKRLCYAAI